MSEIDLGNIFQVGQERKTVEKIGGRVVSTLVKPEATYSFLYVTHADRITPQMLNEKATHVWMETGPGDWYEQPVTMLSSFRKTMTEFRTMLPVIEGRQVPILFGELSVNNTIGTVDFFTEFGINTMEGFLSLAMWAYLAMNAKDIQLTRRDFFKAGKKVLVGGTALWLSLPALSFLGRLATTLSGEGHEITTVMKKISNNLHPEDFTLSEQLRGTLLSYKEKWLAKKLKNNPYFLSPLGGDHSRVEVEIDEAESRQLEYLTNWAPVLRAVVKPETFSEIKALKYDGKQWIESNKWQIPELKRIVAS